MTTDLRRAALPLGAARPRLAHGRCLCRCLLVAGVVLLSGCGASEGRLPGAPSKQAVTTSAPVATAARGEFGTADVRVVEALVAHHAQAMRIAALVNQKAPQSSLGRLLAQRSPVWDSEGHQMAGWLDGWGSAIPAVPAKPGGRGDKAPQVGPGGVQESELLSLDAMEGEPLAAVSRTLLRRSLAGTQDAVRGHLDQTLNPEVKELTQRWLREAPRLESLLGE